MAGSISARLHEAIAHHAAAGRRALIGSEPVTYAELGRLIDGYAAHGGTESGFMRERDGKTVLVVDHQHKRRSDWTIEDEALRETLRQRVLRRIVPEIQRAFQFKTTRM